MGALALSSSHSLSSANMMAVCAGSCVHVVELATLKHVYMCVCVCVCVCLCVCVCVCVHVLAPRSTCTGVYV